MEDIGKFFLLLYIKIIVASNVATYSAIFTYYLILGKTDTATAIALHYLATGTALFIVVPLFILTIPIALLTAFFMSLFQ